MNVCRDAVVCQDGHSFCSLCLTKAKEANYNRCPMDRSYLGSSVPARNRALDALISKMRVQCPTTADGCSGCKWTGTLEQVEAHAELDCSMVMTSCPNDKCPVKLYRYELEQHKTSCPFKKKLCTQCGKQVSVQEEEHGSVCLGQPTKWRNILRETWIAGNT